MGTVKRRADAAERAAVAYSARVAGGTWTEVAKVAGYSDEANARRAVRRVFDEYPAPDREEQRQLVRDRLDGLYRIALKDCHDRRPGAVTAAVRVLELFARLDGLSAPTKVSLIDPTAEQIEEYLDATIGPRGLPEETDVLGDIVDADIIEDEREGPSRALDGVGVPGT